MAVSGAAKEALERVDRLLGELVARASPVREELRAVVGAAPRSLHPFDETDFVLHTTLRAVISALDTIEKAQQDIVAELTKGA
jgi:hypothetical protein